jgi:hypothetical protein
MDSLNNRGDRMMRKVLSIAMMAAMLGLVGMTREAGATITISLEWSNCGGGTGGCTATGGNTITVNAGGGQTLRLDVYLQHDLPGPTGTPPVDPYNYLESHTFSLDFDVSENELNLGPMAQTEWSGFDTDPGPGTATYGPFTSGLTSTESTGSNTGRINNFESASLTYNLPATGLAYSVGTYTATAPTRYRVGQAFFTVNAAATDGADIFAGIFAPGDKFIFGDGLGTIIPASELVLGTATVNVVPEPGTVSLLGLGLVGLILAGRRSRRS